MRLLLYLLLLYPVSSTAQLFNLKTGDSLDDLNYTIDTLGKRWGVVEKNSFTSDYETMKTLSNLPYFATKGGYSISGCNFIMYDHKIESIQIYFGPTASYHELLLLLSRKYGASQAEKENARGWFLPKLGVNIYAMNINGIVAMTYEDRKLLAEKLNDKESDL